MTALAKTMQHGLSNGGAKDSPNKSPNVMRYALTLDRIKNIARLTTLFVLSNLWMTRKHLMGMGRRACERETGLKSPVKIRYVVPTH